MLFDDPYTQEQFFKTCYLSYRKPHNDMSRNPKEETDNDFYPTFGNSCAPLDPNEFYFNQVFFEEPGKICKPVVGS